MMVVGGNTVFTIPVDARDKSVTAYVSYSRDITRGVEVLHLKLNPK